MRKSEERRHIGNQNKKTWMTFDSENKADPLQNGFGALKMLNEELLSPDSGYILNTHMDMVIVTYVQEGVIIYKGPLEKSDLVEANEFRRVDVPRDTKQYAFNISHSEDAHIFQSGFAPSESLLKQGEIK
ncbi:MAG TPA: hypothetical protein VIJ93_01660, partial [bacterium]